MKKFVPTKDTKLKLKADEHITNVARFCITIIINEAVPMNKDYATTASKIIVAVTTSTDKKIEATKKKLKVLIAINAKLMDQLILLTKANINKSANSMHKENSKKHQHKCSHCGGCKNCGGDDKCWELVANSASQPAGWKSQKQECKASGKHRDLIAYLATRKSINNKLDNDFIQKSCFTKFLGHVISAWQNR